MSCGFATLSHALLHPVGNASLCHRYTHGSSARVPCCFSGILGQGADIRINLSRRKELSCQACVGPVKADQQSKNEPLELSFCCFPLPTGVAPGGRPQLTAPVLRLATQPRAEGGRLPPKGWLCQNWGKGQNGGCSFRLPFKAR